MDTNANTTSERTTDDPSPSNASSTSQVHQESRGRPRSRNNTSISMENSNDRESSVNSDEYDFVPREVNEDSRILPTPTYEFPGTWEGAYHQTSEALSEISAAASVFGNAVAQSGITRAGRLIGEAVAATANRNALIAADYVAKTTGTEGRLPLPVRNWLKRKEVLNAAKRRAKVAQEARMARRVEMLEREGSMAEESRDSEERSRASDSMGDGASERHEEGSTSRALNASPPTPDTPSAPSVPIPVPPPVHQPHHTPTNNLPTTRTPSRNPPIPLPDFTTPAHIRQELHKPLPFSFPAYPFDASQSPYRRRSSEEEEEKEEKKEEQEEGDAEEEEEEGGGSAVSKVMQHPDPGSISAEESQQTWQSVDIHGAGESK